MANLYGPYKKFYEVPLEKGPKSIVVSKVISPTDPATEALINSWLPRDINQPGQPAAVGVVLEPYGPGLPDQVLTQYVSEEAWDSTMSSLIPELEFIAQSLGRPRSLVNKNVEAVKSIAFGGTWRIVKWELLETNENNEPMDPTSGDDPTGICDRLTWQQDGTGKTVVSIHGWDPYPDPD